MRLSAVSLNSAAIDAFPDLDVMPVNPEQELPANPFVGLRPFESHESLLFFGRDKQIVELMQQLHRTRLLAVIGGSGCGKSSLVRAGLIPKLIGGFLVEKRERWNVVTLKPGNSPLRNLARAILGAVRRETTEELVSELVRQIRIQGVEAVINYLTAPLNTSEANFFLLIDQFEEIFRFVLSASDVTNKADAEHERAISRTHRSDEAARFVSIMLGLSRQRTLPVYVVITMRSDFVGDYDIFDGLPEAVNGNLYLVPRLNRQQYNDAVKGPIGLYGEEIAPRLLDRVANDLVGESDQLPVMEHALMRTWETWSKTARSSPLDLPQYEAAGTIKNALSRDANKAMQELTEAEVGIAERLFQALVDTDSQGRRVRRPAHLSEIQKITEAPAEQILKVVSHFRSDGRNFLATSSERIEDDPVIDISHESFIRQWDQLREWIDKENESKEIYTRVADAAVRRRDRNGRLWGDDDPDLQQTLDWWYDRKPNEAWARRYHPDFQLTADFLEKSAQQRETERDERERRRAEELESEKIRQRNAQLRRLTFALVFISLLAIASAALARISLNRSKKSAEEAITAKSIADNATREARAAEGRAKAAAHDAELQKAEALKQKVIADKKAKEAQSANIALGEAKKDVLATLGELYRKALSNDDQAAFSQILNLYHDNGSQAGVSSTLILIGDRAANYPLGNPFLTAETADSAIKYYDDAVKNLNESDPRQKLNKISVYIKKANLLYQKADNESKRKAAESYEKALKLSNDQLPKTESPLDVFLKLGQIYADSSDRENLKTAIRYKNRAQDQVDIEIKLGGTYWNSALKPLIDLKFDLMLEKGRLYTLLGQQGDADSEYKNLESLQLKGAKDYKAQAKELLQLSDRLVQPAEENRQYALIEKALNLYRDNRDTVALADNLTTVATNYNVLGTGDSGNPVFLDRALKYFDEAAGLQRIAHNSGSEQQLRKSIAEINLRLNRTSEALSNFQRALDICYETKDFDCESNGIRRQLLLSIGDVNVKVNKLEEALKSYQSAREICSNNKTNLFVCDDSSEVQLLMSIGDVDVKLNKSEEALKSYQSAREICSNNKTNPFVCDDSVEQHLLVSIGDVYLKLKNRQEALKSYQDALGICNKANRSCANIEAQIKAVQSPPRQ